MMCRNGCDAQVFEDDLCENCVIEDLVEYCVNYRRENDPDPPVLVLVNDLPT